MGGVRAEAAAAATAAAEVRGERSCGRRGTEPVVGSRNRVAEAGDMHTHACTHTRPAHEGSAAVSVLRLMERRFGCVERRGQRCPGN